MNRSIHESRTRSIPSRELSRAGLEQLPAAIGRAGEAAAWRFVEFFGATIRNRNTRAAYAQAVMQFFAWCEKHRLYTFARNQAARRLLHTSRTILRPRRP